MDEVFSQDGRRDGGAGGKGWRRQKAEAEGGMVAGGEKENFTAREKERSFPLAGLPLPALGFGEVVTFLETCGKWPISGGRERGGHSCKVNSIKPDTKFLNTPVYAAVPSD